MSSLRVFVYGTLKPGHENHNRYCRDRLIANQEAKIKGELYALPVGYPGLCHGDQWIQGVLLTLLEDGRTLTELDALEEYHPHDPSSLYQRRMTHIYTLDGQGLGWAWVYWMDRSMIQSMQGQLLRSGRW